MAFEVLEHTHLAWVNCTSPVAPDMDYLRQRFGFHPLALEDSLSHRERPKIDEYDGYVFIVMHFPFFDHDRSVTRPYEVDFFIGPGYLVTIHEGTLRAVQAFWQECRSDAEARARWMSKGVGVLLYHLLDHAVEYIGPMMEKVAGKISAIEERMFSAGMEDTLQDISFIRRDVIVLRRIVRAQLPIVMNLERKERPYIQEELDVYFGDIADAFARASDTVDDFREVIEGLSATADIVTSHRTNEVIRILTVISVTMLPLTLIAGIFGMNVALPSAHPQVDFLLIVGLMLTVVAGMLIFFRRRHWL